jgi:hypothetical protein
LKNKAIYLHRRVPIGVFLFFYKALFSNLVAFEEKKLIVIIFTVVKKDFIFEKRAANLVKM